MAEVFGIIAGLGHSPERKKLDRIIFRCVLGGSEQVVQLLGYFLSIGCRSHPVAEVADEVTEALDLLLVRLVMDTIHEGLRLLAGSLLRSLPYSLAAGRDKLCDGPVGKKHELLDEPVSLLCHLLVYIDRTSRLVYLDLHFRTVEADCSCREPLLAELCRKAVQYEDSILYLFCNAFMRSLRSGLDYRLSLFVCKSEVRIDHSLTEPLAHDTSKRGHLEDSRECQLLFMRTEGAELVAELLRKHRHSPVDQIYRSTTGLRLLIDHVARLHIMGDVSDMDSYFVISIFKPLER